MMRQSSLFTEYVFEGVASLYKLNGGKKAPAKVAPEKVAPEKVELA